MYRFIYVSASLVHDSHCFGEFPFTRLCPALFSFAVSSCTCAFLILGFHAFQRSQICFIGWKLKRPRSVFSCFLNVLEYTSSLHLSYDRRLFSIVIILLQFVFWSLAALHFIPRVFWHIFNVYLFMLFLGWLNCSCLYIVVINFLILCFIRLLYNAYGRLHSISIICVYLLWQA